MNSRSVGAFASKYMPSFSISRIVLFWALATITLWMPAAGWKKEAGNFDVDLPSRDIADAHFRREMLAGHPRFDGSSRWHEPEGR